MCGTCGIKFVQNDPTAHNYVYKDRRPVPQEGPKKLRKNLEPETEPTHTDDAN